MRWFKRLGSDLRHGLRVVPVELRLMLRYVEWVTKEDPRMVVFHITEVAAYEMM